MQSRVGFFVGEILGDFVGVFVGADVVGDFTVGADVVGDFAVGADVVRDFFAFEDFPPFDDLRRDFSFAATMNDPNDPSRLREVKSTIIDIDTETSCSR